MFRTHKRTKSALTLESLPPLVLDWIFEYTRSPDLAKMSGLSRDLYWPIVRRIYRSIAFVSGNEISEETDWLNGSVVNYCTIIPKPKIEEFVISLEINLSLRDLVQSVNVLCDIPAILVKALFGVLTNVTAYCARQGYTGLDKIRSKLEKLIVYISKAPPLSPYLVELRIVGNACKPPGKWYRTLAQDLCRLRGHSSLRKLHLETHASDFYLEKWGRNLPLPDWFMFLDELIAQKVTLYLTALGLYGTIDTFALATIRKLRRCVYLEEVHTLVLCVSPGQVPGETFVEKITRFTPQLDSLAISSTLRKSMLPSGAICNVLENNVPNQLKELLILYSPHYDLEGDRMTANAVRDKIQTTILKSQKNLVKLKLEDRSWVVHQKGWSESGRHAFRHSFTIDFYREEYRQKDFLCIFGSPLNHPRLSKKSVKLVKRHILKFRKVMKKDLICSKAGTNLPFLKEYFIDMIAFDLKRHGVIVNDEVILLDPLSVAKILWQLHEGSMKWKRFVSYVKEKW